MNKREWFIMAASTVSFYTNEEAYNKTNIQEPFQNGHFWQNCGFRGENQRNFV